MFAKLMLRFEEANIGHLQSRFTEVLSEKAR